MTVRTDRVAFGLACGVACVLILFRSAVWIWWPQSHFDSDQATYGLMARHIGQGRSFPLVMYGQNYMLAVEAWLAAPLFMIFGSSVTLLKLPVLALNIAAAAVLIRILIVDGRLSPIAAVIASLFFVLPPPVTSSRLVEAAGGNIEPVLYAVMLWALRRRPIAFGVIAGLGIANREFTAYAVVALLVVEAWQRRFSDASHRRQRAISLAIAAVILIAIALIKPHTALVGPGSAGSPAAAAVSATSLPSCLQPGEWWSNVRWLAGQNLGTLFGWRRESLGQYANSTSVVGHGSAGFALGTLALLAIAAAAGAVRRRGESRTAAGSSALSMYLIVIGIESLAGSVVLPCVGRDAMLIRYILMALLLPIGLTAYLLHPSRSRVWRVAPALAVLVWAGLALRDNGEVITEFQTHPPKNEIHDFVKFLEDNGVHYGKAPYWTAYAVDFVSDERVILAPTGFPRIREYDDLVARHAQEAARISDDNICGGPPALQFSKWCVRRGPD